MNPLAGNLLVPQEENNRPTTGMSLAHCIFRWKIHKISFCLAYSQFYFVSSIFKLTDGSNWCLRLLIRNREDTCTFQIQLCRLPGESNLERIKVRFSLTLQLPEGNTLDSLRNEVCSFLERETFSRDYNIHLSALKDLLNIVKDDDMLVIECEMLAVVATNAVSGNPHPGNRYFSKNLIKLLEDNLLTNISLLVEGNRGINAHKEILSIWSNQFAELLTETSGCYKCSLEIEYYTYEVVKAMLAFVYSGNLNELTANDPPPIELCECAEYYGIIGLADILQPLEIVEVFNIRNANYGCYWYIPNLLTLYEARNVIKLPLDDGSRRDSEVLADSEIILWVDFRSDDWITFYIVISGARTGSIISNDITFSDFFYETFPVREIKQLLGCQTCTFKASLAVPFVYENIRHPYDVLFIHCNFRCVSPPIEYYTEGKITLRDFDSGGYNWNILSTRMEELFRIRPHTDIEIEVMSSQALIKKSAHKSVLCARSPECRKVLSTPNEEGRIFLRCSSRSATEFLYYTYTGILRNCSVRTLIDLHNFACEFSIPDLKVKCLGLLHLRVTCFTACKICLFADEYGYRYLKWKCFYSIFQNQNAISFRWRALLREKPILAAEISEYVDQQNEALFLSNLESISQRVVQPEAI